ncbi:hypothetical protein LCGC14_2695420 [marine sediment metagenome]|uniref:Uncharacterized protein n=1 Tax=marine sediment metagenome TaxID=412755 RepID=A0A0F9BRS2_9ZZZZ
MQGITTQAIEMFKAAIAAEEQAERANQALNRIVGRIPAKDLAEYASLTEGFR